MLVGLSEGLATAGAGYSTSYTTGYSSDGGFSTYTTRSYSPAAASMASMASAERVANFGLAMEQEQNVKRMGYLKRNTINPARPSPDSSMLTGNGDARLFHHRHRRGSIHL